MKLMNQDEIKDLVQENINNMVGQEVIDSIVTVSDDVVTSSPDIPRLEGSTYYQGKVRANFYGGDLITKDDIPLRVLITLGNISTHDKFKGVVPFKDQITSELSNYMFDLIKGTLPNSQIAAQGIVAVAEQCQPMDFEMVLRKYMAKSGTKTSLYHNYVDLGKREFCGHKLPEGLVANGKLPYIMDTPSTKAKKGGHDESVSPQYLFDQSIVTPEDYAIVRNASIEAFGMGEAFLTQLGIILVDDKKEAGRGKDGRIKWIDEVLTLDAARYWKADDYEEKLSAGENPTSYSKEIARGLGEPGVPLTEQQVFQVACRYVDTYQLLTGKRFVEDLRDSRKKIVQDVNKCLDMTLAT